MTKRKVKVVQAGTETHDKIVVTTEGGQPSMSDSVYVERLAELYEEMARVGTVEATQEVPIAQITLSLADDSLPTTFRPANVLGDMLAQNEEIQTKVHELLLLLQEHIPAILQREADEYEKAEEPVA